MHLDITLLRTSFSLVRERRSDYGARFYEILFERFSEAKALFGDGSPANREIMLQEAMLAVMHHLDDEPWLREALGSLGRKHATYGVRLEMYEWVRESLIATLTEILGPDSSVYLEEVWGKAFDVIAQMMKDGARRD